jgi:signal transduction histidine kinase
MSELTPLTVVERYKQLVKILQELASILNTEMLMEQIVNSAVTLCDASTAWILLLDQQHQELHLETTSLPSNSQYRGLVVPIGTSLEGWVLENQLPVLINDSSLYDHHYGETISLTNLEIKSILSIPVTTKDKRIGVLEVFNQQAGDFNSLDQEILVSFANQVAIYIDNTKLFLQSDLVAELVHELHTPLASLNTAVHLLQRSDLPTDKREQISAMIQTEFYRLTHLTTSLLDYARLESGRAKFQPSKFDLSQLLADSVKVMQMQADGKGIKILLDIPDNPLYLNADKDKIKQVVLNLLNNAIKYNRPGGRINVKAQVNRTGLSFSIQDDGQGIPPEYIPRLFDRFYRAPFADQHAKGIGLGLTICKQIVEGHKGKIDVSSKAGKGSTFIVHLPINRET